MKPRREEPGPDVPLAVVVPAFRGRYLQEMLASFAAQTDRRFHMYIADDGSPEPLAASVAPFAGRLALTYHRFEDNLGLPGMVQHWHRAIALSREPWVWLFSDDDAVAPDCVATLLGELERAPETRSLLRFDVEFIDGNSAPLRREAGFPRQLSAAEYAHRLLTRDRDPCMIQNVVFRRSIFDAEGGFSPALGGYCSDYATWPRFARMGGIRRLDGGKVYFRYHDTSVGAFVGFHAPRRAEAIEAYRQALHAIRFAVGVEEASQARWRRAEFNWFTHWFRYLPRPLNGEEREQVAEVMAELWLTHRWAARFWFWKNYSQALLRLAGRRVKAVGAVRRFISARRA